MAPLESIRLPEAEISEVAAAAPEEPPEPPTRNPRRLSRRVAVALPAPAGGKPMRPQLRPVAPAPQPTSLPPSQLPGEAWSSDFIARAENECGTLLASIAVESRTLPAFREGQCGAPAARLLSSISTSPRVELRPAATLTCKMVAALALWFRDDVQPLAKQDFGSEVKGLYNISSFVCRNRYGDTEQRISEHAFANALDVAGFELADGRKVMVEDGWNEIESGKSAFLHALHDSACKRFGTVLGPDANEAHKNHLHIDMAPRKQTNYCR